MKKEIKEFAREHKKELLIGAGLAIGGLSMYLLGRSSMKNSDHFSQKIIDTINKGDQNAKNFVNFIKISNDVKKDSAYYTEFDTAGFVKMTGENTIVDDEGVIYKVAGGIIFMDPVRKVKKF